MKKMLRKLRTAKTVTKRRRLDRRMRMESLETRQLMAGDLGITTITLETDPALAVESSDSSTEAAAATTETDITTVTAQATTLSQVAVDGLKDGLDNFAQWTSAIGHDALPVGEDGFDQVINDSLERGFVQPLIDYLAANDTPTVEGLTNFLQTLGSGNTHNDLVVTPDANSVSVQLSATSLQVDVQFETVRISQVSLENLGGAHIVGNASQLPSVTLTGQSQFKLAFEVDLTDQGQTSAERFFFNADPQRTAISVQADIATQDIDGAVNISFIGANVQGGTASVDAQAVLSFQDLGNDGRVSLAELNSHTVEGPKAASLAVSGSFQVTLPVEVSIGSLTESGVITVFQDDLANDDGPTVAVEGMDGWAALARLDATSVYQMFHRIRFAMEGLTRSAEFQETFPFANDMKVSDVVNFVSTLDDDVLAPLSGEGGTPTFDNAQQMVEQWATASGVGADVFQLHFDKQNQELTLQLNLQDQSDGTANLALDVDWGRLLDVELGSAEHPDPMLQWQSNVAAHFKVALDLKPSAGTTTPSNPWKRIALRDATFSGSVEAAVENLDGKARIGIFGVELDDGSGSANLDVELDVSGLADGLDDVTITPTLGGSAQVNIPVQLTGTVAGVVLPVETAVVIEWSDVTDVDSLDARLEPGVELDDLLNSLESVAIGHVVDALLSAVDFLEEAQSRHFFQEDIPVLNRNLSDLLDASERLEDIRQELEDNPPTTIGELIERLSQALGGGDSDSSEPEATTTSSALSTQSLAATSTEDTEATEETAATEIESAAENPKPVTVSFKDRVLEVDLAYGFEKTHDLDLGFDLDNQLDAEVLKEFIDLNASAPINLAIGGVAELGLVVDVNETFSPKFFIKDSSRVEIHPMANASDIDLEAAVGPLGIFVKDGHVRLNNGTAGEAAVFAVSLLPAQANGRHKISDLIANASELVDFDATGRLDVVLPTYFPTQDEEQGEIVVQVADLANIASTTSVSKPDFEAAIDSLDLSDVLDVLVEGFDRVLSMVSQSMEGTNLPMIGDRLPKIANFLEDVRQEVVEQLESIQTLGAETIQNKIFEALGPQNLNLLLDRPDDADDIVTAEDVGLSLDFTSLGILKEVDYQFTLGKDWTEVVPLNFDRALGGLGLEVDADLEIDLGMQFDVGFGVNLANGFYVHTGAADEEPELQIALDARIAGSDDHQMATTTADLWFLQLDVEDQEITRADESTSGSYFLGQFTVDLVDPQGNDQRLTFGEAVTSSLGEIVQPRLDATAHVKLDLEASYEGDTRFPRLGADFELLWRFDTSDPDLNGTLQEIGFDNVRMNVGEFMNNMIDPVLDRIESVLQPVIPIAEALQAPLPVLSNLMGKDYSILDLAKDIAQTNPERAFISPETVKFIEAVGKIAEFPMKISNMLNSLEDAGGDGWIDFSGFLLDPEAVQDEANLGELQPLTEGQPEGEIDADKRQGIQDFEDSSGFSVPVFKNPGSLFNLLLGRDIVLATYDMPRLELEFSYDQFFPILGPLGVSMSGVLGAVADFKFGYDSSGLRQFAESGYEEPQLILNGLYISDTAATDGSGIDIPEVEIYGGLRAYAAVDVAVASVGGGGGITANFKVDLNDPNEDGRVYFQELAGAFEGTGTLGRLLNFSGELSGVLSVYAEVLFIRYEKDIARVELLDYTTNSEPEIPEPILGEIDSAGKLTLNMGPRAAMRLHHNTSDHGEDFEIVAGADPNTVIVKYHIPKGPDDEETPPPFTKEFSNVMSIVGMGGLGNDTITVARDVSVPVHLSGGAGHDRLVAGSGHAELSGDDGDDHLTAGDGSALLQGGDGNDTLIGGMADDEMRGGGGNDRLHGGAGNDTQYGDAGNDWLYGGTGQDVLDGGQGDDQVEGQEDSDVLRGGDGDDTLDGGEGNDAAHGGRGQDVLTGGAGDDALYGDADEDQIDGGLGDDLLDGGRGNDALFGGDGVDQLFGKLGQDLLDGGAGNDVLDGGLGIDELFGGVGDDELFGHFGLDQLFGGQGSDWLFGGEGSDQLSGGADGDMLYGGNGQDRLYGSSASPGGQGNDEVDDGDDHLFGGDDDDVLYGGRGNDVLMGQQGADLIHGQNGDDTIRYAVDAFEPAGVDQLFGGNNHDAIELVGTDDGDRMQIQQVDTADYTVERLDEKGQIVSKINFALPESIDDRDIERLRVDGGAGNDRIEASGEFNIGQLQLSGGAGNDTIQGGDSNDLITGGSGDDLLMGGAGKDEIYGGEDDDSIFGESGSDALYGQDGNDVIDGGQGSDNLFGGLGSDLVMAGEGPEGDRLDGGDHLGAEDESADTLIGGDGQDIMHGGGGDDVIEGRGGNDTIYGDGGNDWIQGDSGDDHVNGGDGHDTIQGGTGADYLAGDEGNDVIHAVSESTIDDDRQSDDQQSIQLDKLEGGEGDDYLRGSTNKDNVYGNQGNDTIVHTPGDDIVYGGAGDADRYVVQGTAWDDTFEISQQIGSGGNYVTTVEFDQASVQIDHSGIEVAGIDALGGNDHVSFQDTQQAGLVVFADGGQGNDVLDGTFARNSVELHGGAGNDVITGGATKDTLIGGQGDDIIDGGGHNDVIRGGAGNDTLRGRAGSDDIDGGEDQDRLIEEVADHVVLQDDSLIHYDSSGAEHARDTLASIEAVQLTGSEHADIIDASAFSGSTELVGLGGNDQLLGGNSVDQIFGGAGNDYLSGGSGNDILYGDDGNDVLEGGSGNDRMGGGAHDDVLSSQLGNDIVDGGDGTDEVREVGDVDFVLADTILVGLGQDELVSIERGHLTGGGGDNHFNAGAFSGQVTLLGGSGNDTLLGGLANDHLEGQDGADELRGGLGNDVLDGGRGDDTLFGDAGDDLLIGAVGNDVLDGGADNDRLEGNAGDDTLWGGSGDDLVFGEYEIVQSGTPIAVPIHGTYNDVIHGGAGNDTISGGYGNDRIEGNEGNDLIQGDSGSDSLYGGKGADTLKGGSENDWLRGDHDMNGTYHATSDVNRLHGDGGDDHLYGGSYMDYMYGGYGADRMYGGYGNDYVYGGPGNDYLYGQSGSDRLYGEDGNDRLYGGSHNDSLYGGNGTDRLYGQSGNDLLNGGRDGSSDYLQGDSGRDTFYQYYTRQTITIGWWSYTTTVAEERLADVRSSDGDWVVTPRMF